MPRHNLLNGLRTLFGRDQQPERSPRHASLSTGTAAKTTPSVWSALTPPSPQRRPLAGEVPNPERFDVHQIRDRVVHALLHTETATLKQVEDAWHRWQRTRREGGKEVLWREVARDPHLAEEAVYAIAARVYAFREIAFTTLGSMIMIQKLDEHVSEAQWDALAERRLLPVVERGWAPGEAQRLAFATHDPTHPEVRRLLDQLSIVEAYQLRYAPKASIEALIAEAFPRMRHLAHRSEKRYTTRAYVVNGVPAIAAPAAPDSASYPRAA